MTTCSRKHERAEHDQGYGYKRVGEISCARASSTAHSDPASDCCRAMITRFQHRSRNIKAHRPPRQTQRGDTDRGQQQTVHVHVHRAIRHYVPIADRGKNCGGGICCEASPNRLSETRGVSSRRRESSVDIEHLQYYSTVGERRGVVARLQQNPPASTGCLRGVSRRPFTKGVCRAGPEHPLAGNNRTAFARYHADPS